MQHGVALTLTGASVAFTLENIVAFTLNGDVAFSLKHLYILHLDPCFYSWCVLLFIGN